MERSKETDREDNPDGRLRSPHFETFPDKIDSPIDEQIRTAQAQGKFDNLPGFGKPLPRDESYELAGEHWMSNHILKQAGYLPIWLELRKEIAAERSAVEDIRDRYRKMTRRLDPDSPATRASLNELEQRYVELAAEINVKIDQHNDRCPNTQLLNRFPEDALRRWS